jgi:hypothetical protein
MRTGLKKPFENQFRRIGKTKIFTVSVLITLCIVALSLAPVLKSQVIYFDDVEYFYKNENVKNPSLQSAVGFLDEILYPSTVRGYYQPLSMISLMVDVWFGATENNLTIFHVTSLMLHLANTAMLTVVLFLFFKKPVLSALGGLLFGLHPTAIESIAWISERKTLLATFFVLLALLFYILYVQKDRKKFFWTSVGLFFLSLLSKPTTITFPLLLLLLDWWPLKRLSKKTAVEKLPFLELSAVSALVTYVSQKYSASVVLPSSRPLLDSILLPFYNISFYIGKIFVPINQSGFYGFPDPFTLGNPTVLIHVIGSLLIIAAVLISLKRTKSIFAGFSFFIIAISPSMNVIQFTPVIAADRFLYLPIIGMLLTVVYLLSRLAERLGTDLNRQNLRRLAVCTVLSIVLIFAEAQAARHYIPYWKDTMAIFKRNYDVSPDNYITCYDLGSYLLGKEQFAEGEFYVNECIRLKPDYIDAYCALGVSYYKRGETEKALELFRKAVEIEPDSIAKAYVGVLEQDSSL